MKYNLVSYLIGEGFKNVLKNKKMTIASLMIMCATMLIFGLFFIIGENIDTMVSSVEEAQGMEVFINSETDELDIKKLGEEIKSIDGVNTIQFVSKEEALNRMKERFKDKPDLMTGFEKNNIFPESYIITLTDLSLSRDVQDQIKTLDNVKKITSRDDTISTLITLAKWIRIVTGVILILLILISVFIIANTIKIAVHSRRREISIMKYVGATNGFIRWPFIVEGIIIGLLASLIAILILGAAYNGIADKVINSKALETFNFSLVSFGEMFDKIILVYIVLGIGIGTIGSSISMKRYLQV